MATGGVQGRSATRLRVPRRSVIPVLVLSLVAMVLPVGPPTASADTDTVRLVVDLVDPDGDPVSSTDWSVNALPVDGPQDPIIADRDVDGGLSVALPLPADPTAAEEWALRARPVDPDGTHDGPFHGSEELRVLVGDGAVTDVETGQVLDRVALALRPANLPLQLRDGTGTGLTLAGLPLVLESEVLESRSPFAMEGGSGLPITLAADGVRQHDLPDGTHRVRFTTDPSRTSDLWVTGYLTVEVDAGVAQVTGGTSGDGVTELALVAGNVRGEVLALSDDPTLRVDAWLERRSETFTPGDEFRMSGFFFDDRRFAFQVDDGTYDLAAWSSDPLQIPPPPQEIVVTEGEASPAAPQDLQLRAPSMEVEVRTADGAACQGCEVEARGVDEDGAFRGRVEGSTDTDGVVVLGVAQPGTWTVTASDGTVEAAGEVVVDADGNPDPARLVLQLPVPNIEAWLLDRDGAPCGSCTVSARSYTDAGSRSVSELGSVGDDGRFLAYLEPTGGTTWLLQAGDTAAGRTGDRSRHLLVGEDGTIDGLGAGDVLPIEPHNLTIEVRDEVGDPASASVNTLSTVQGRNWVDPIDVPASGSVTTWLPDGVSAISGVRFVDEEVVNLVGTSVTVTDGQAEPDRVTLGPRQTAPIEVRLVLPDGTPVDGEVVAFQAGVGSVVADSDPESGIAVLALPDGTHQLRAEDAHPVTAMPAETTIEVVDGAVQIDGSTIAGPVELTLTPATMHGVMRDAVGEPYPGAQLSIDDLPGEPPSETREVSFDDAGGYAVLLGDGAHGLSISAADPGRGTPSTVLGVRVTDGIADPPPPGDLQLRAENVVGTVTTPPDAAEPYATARVFAVAVDGGAVAEAITTPEAEGSFGLLLGDGQHRVWAEPVQPSLLGRSETVTITMQDGRLQAVDGTDADGLALVLTYANVAGTLVDDVGDPVPFTALTLEVADEPRPLPDPEGRHVVVSTDEQGRWGARLPAGTFDARTLVGTQVVSLATIEVAVDGTVTPSPPIELVRPAPPSVGQAPTIDDLQVTPGRAPAPSDVQLQAWIGHPTDERFTFTIDWGDGTVETRVDEPLDVQGRFVADHSYPAPGEYIVSLTVAGDGGSDADTRTVQVTAPTTTALTAPERSIHGQHLTLEAQVSTEVAGLGTPTGPVAFSADGEPLGTALVDADGVASLALTTELDGSPTAYQLTASYGGAATFEQSASDATAHLVDPAETELEVVTWPRWVQPDQPFSVASLATVLAPGGGLPDGPRDLVIRPASGGAPVLERTDVAASEAIEEGLPRGDYVVTVTLRDTDNHLGSTASLRFVSSPLRLDDADPDDPDGGGGGGGDGSGGGIGGGDGGGDGEEPDAPITWRSFPAAEGPLADVATSEYLHCLVRFDGDLLPAVAGNRAPSAGDYAGGTDVDAPYTPPGDGTTCVTVVVVDGEVYLPPEDLRPQSLFGGEHPLLVPVSQSAVTGSGTAADPWRIETVVDLEGTAITVTQVDTFVAGDDSYASRVTVDGAAADADVEVRRFAHCQVSNDQRGYPVNDEDAGAVGCRSWEWAADGTPTARGDRALMLGPLDPPSEATGSGYRYDDAVAITSVATSVAGFDRRLLGCASEADNAVAVSVEGAQVGFRTGFRTVSDDDCVERPGTAPLWTPQTPTSGLLVVEDGDQLRIGATDADPTDIDLVVEVRQAATGEVIEAPDALDCAPGFDARGNPVELVCTVRGDNLLLSVAIDAVDADGNSAGPRRITLIDPTYYQVRRQALAQASRWQATLPEVSGAIRDWIRGLDGQQRRSAADLAALERYLLLDLATELSYDSIELGTQLIDDALDNALAEAISALTGAAGILLGDALKDLIEPFANELVDRVVLFALNESGKKLIAEVLGLAVDEVQGSDIVTAIAELFAAEEDVGAFIRQLNRVSVQEELLGAMAAARVLTDAEPVTAEEVREVFLTVTDETNQGMVQAGGVLLGVEAAQTLVQSGPLVEDEQMLVNLRTTARLLVTAKFPKAAKLWSYVDIGISALYSPYYLMSAGFTASQVLRHPGRVAEGRHLLGLGAFGTVALTALTPVTDDVVLSPEEERWDLGGIDTEVTGYSQTVVATDQPSSIRFILADGREFDLDAARVQGDTEAMHLDLDDVTYAAISGQRPERIEVTGLGDDPVELTWSDPFVGFAQLRVTAGVSDPLVLPLRADGTLIVPDAAGVELLDGFGVGLAGQDPIPPPPEADADPDDGTGEEPGGGGGDLGVGADGPGAGDAEVDVLDRTALERVITPELVAAVCASEVVAGTPFIDLAGDGAHDRPIVCAAERGLVRGFVDGTYGTHDDMTRGQVATLLVGTAEELGVELPAAGEARFPDIAGSTHRAAIERLAAAGIVRGYADGTFGPDDSVSRGQFTTMLMGLHTRAAGGVLVPEGTAGFLDIRRSVHAEAIDAAAAVGLADGIDAERFAPQRAVSRGQSASFAVRLLAWFTG